MSRVFRIIKDALLAKRIPINDYCEICRQVSPVYLLADKDKTTSLLCITMFQNQHDRTRQLRHKQAQEVRSFTTDDKQKPDQLA